MLNNPEWGAFYLWKNGAIVPENAARCPKTLIRSRRRPPGARGGPLAFDPVLLLRPVCADSAAHGRSEYPPHLPFAADRPDKCSFRVATTRARLSKAGPGCSTTPSSTRPWNGSDRTRVILLFEIWRPSSPPRSALR